MPSTISGTTRFKLRLMKRQMIVFYTSIILMILAGRYAWVHCEWGWVARVSAIGVIIAILIEGWHILTSRGGDDVTLLQGRTVASARVAILVLCAGIFIAGFGEMLGKAAFGCAAP